MAQTSNLPASYAVLRHGGASPTRAQAELAISASRAWQLEALFRVRRPGKGGEGARPRFARNRSHVEAVLRAGGFPVLRR